MEHRDEKYFGGWLYPNEKMGVKGVRPLGCLPLWISEGVPIAISLLREKMISTEQIFYNHFFVNDLRKFFSERLFMSRRFYRIVQSLPAREGNFPPGFCQKHFENIYR